MKKFLISGFLMLSLSAPLVLAAPNDNKQAAAQGAKEPEPETQVLSDSLDYEDKTKTSIFTGNVILTRGLMRLTADKLVVSEDENGTKHGTATMNKGLIHIVQERPEQYEVIRAQGIKGTYEGAGDVLHLTGQAVVTRYVCGKAVDNVRGHEVIYNNKDSTYHAISSRQDGRVRSIASGRDRVDAATQECRAKYGGKPMPSTIEAEKKKEPQAGLPGDEQPQAYPDQKAAPAAPAAAPKHKQ